MPEVIKHSPDIQNRLAAASLSVKYAAKFLFEEQFYTPFAQPHHEMFRLIDSDSQKVAIAAPRGIGKTTIARTVAEKAILFRDINFITYISRSATHAEAQTENIKRELLSNQLIRKLFGNIKISDADLDMDETFSKKAWTAFGNTFVLPRGAGQQVRGLNWAGYRPQLIIVDDLEDKKEVRNEDLRTSLKDWFFSDLMKSVDKFSNIWRVIYIDTIKHEDSLLQNLLDAPDWDSVRLSLCDADYNTLVPAYMTTDEIQVELEQHREKGILESFYMEYMNQVTGEHSAFKSEYFKYYDEKDIQHRKDIENILLADPAKTVNPGSAESAIVCVGIDNKEKRYLVRDVVADKLLPDQFFNEIFLMAARWNARVVGIEETSLNEFVRQPFLSEKMKRGASFEVVWLKPRGGEKKEERIVSLVPYYRQGEIWHNRACCGPLEAQLIPFPRSARLDIIDALAYMVQLLEIGMRYFGPPDFDDPEAEFRELEDEDFILPPLGKWRLV